MVSNNISSKTQDSVRTLAVDADRANQRLDNFLLGQLHGVPKSRIYRLIRTGQVRVNSKRIKPDYRLQAGDMLRIPPIRQAERQQYPANKKLLDLLSTAIIYQDKDILVLNKPSGVAVHGGSGIQHGVIEILRQLTPELQNLELVHRLDRATSGCLLLAKNHQALKQIHAQWGSGEIEKGYLALVLGRWRGDNCRVNLPLRRGTVSSGERMVRVDDNGKEAITEFSLREKYAHASLIEAILKTGRTHQIRVHAAYLGHPIAGDDKYGNRDFNKSMRALGLKRMFLHANRLKFCLPNGKNMDFTIELPAELLEFLKRLSS